jgi:acetyl esterase/lipase
MKLNRVLMLAAAAAMSPVLAAQGWPPSADHVTMQIWPGTPPDNIAQSHPEEDASTVKDNLIAGRPLVRLANVSTPTVTLYRAKERNTGAAVVVFPGGGYNILAIDLEGTEVCDWLTSAGVNCVLLKYRVPATGPYPKSPAALEDAQRAVRLVRQHAAEWGIAAKRVGVLGFSAGGHLSAAISNLYDEKLYAAIDAADSLSARPDFSVVVYPGYLAVAEKDFAANEAIKPTKDTPPTFIVQAEDDPVHVENAVVYFTQLKKAGVPAELHVFAQGGHGYGLRPTDLPVTRWPRLVETWMRTIKVLPPK